MASNELIIDDDYFRAMGLHFIEQGEQIDKLIDDYISILEEVKNKAIVSGDVSKALDSYIMFVAKISKKIGSISTSTTTEIDRFLLQVDSEDKYLF